MSGTGWKLSDKLANIKSLCVKKEGADSFVAGPQQRLMVYVHRELWCHSPAVQISAHSVYLTQLPAYLVSFYKHRLYDLTEITQ